MGDQSDIPNQTAVWQRCGSSPEDGKPIIIIPAVYRAGNASDLEEACAPASAAGGAVPLVERVQQYLCKEFAASTGTPADYWKPTMHTSFVWALESFMAEDADDGDEPISIGDYLVSAIADLDEADKRGVLVAIPAKLLIEVDVSSSASIVLKAVQRKHDGTASSSTWALLLTSASRATRRAPINGVCHAWKRPSR